MPARLSEDRWRLVIPYLDRGLELAPGDRPAWLAAVADQDPDLARDLTDLLDQHDRLDAQGLLAGAAPQPTPRGSLEGQTLGAYTPVAQEFRRSPVAFRAAFPLSLVRVAMSRSRSGTSGVDPRPLHDSGPCR